MKLKVGERYRDGFDREHIIVGEVPGKPGIFFSHEGYWFFEDGRIHYRVTPEPCKFDLIIPIEETTCVIG